MIRVPVVFGFACMVISTVAAPALAQEAPKPVEVQAGQVRIFGRVEDTDHRPIEDAEVAVRGLPGIAHTGPGGRFDLSGIRPGATWILVRRIGYFPASFTATFTAGASQEYLVTMASVPQRLADVEVKEESGFGRAAQRRFEMQRHAGWSRMIPRDELERLAGLRLSQIARRLLPFAVFEENPFAEAGTAGRSGGIARAGGRGHCGPAVSVNGNRPTMGWRVDDFYPGEVEALEVFRPGLGGMPIDFMFDRQAEECGVVVIWLRT